MYLHEWVKSMINVGKQLGCVYDERKKWAIQDEKGHFPDPKFLEQKGPNQDFKVFWYLPKQTHMLHVSQMLLTWPMAKL